MNFDDVKYFVANSKEAAIVWLNGQVVWQRVNYHLDGKWKLGALPFTGFNHYNLNGTWKLGQYPFTECYLRNINNS